MKGNIIIGLLSCIILAISLSTISPANAATAEEEIIQVSTNFGKALNTSDIDLMASLWWNSPKASLFGPNKNEAFLIQGYEAILNNFKGLLKSPAGAINASSHNVQVTMLEDNVAVITGYATAIFNPPAVKEQTVYQDRSTMVVRKIDGKWLIAHAQVSGFPVE